MWGGRRNNLQSPCEWEPGHWEPAPEQGQPRENNMVIETNESQGGCNNFNPKIILPVFLLQIRGHWHMLEQDL